ncbi:MAG: T9SS type A sorting domain-containing protein, partial [bacterium]
MYDLTGRSVKEEELSRGSVKIWDLSAEPAGVYYVKLSYKESLDVKKVVLLK